MLFLKSLTLRTVVCYTTKTTIVGSGQCSQPGSAHGLPDLKTCPLGMSCLLKSSWTVRSLTVTPWNFSLGFALAMLGEPNSLRVLPNIELTTRHENSRCLINLIRPWLAKKSNPWPFQQDLLWFLHATIFSFKGYSTQTTLYQFQTMYTFNNTWR